MKASLYYGVDNGKMFGKRGDIKIAKIPPTSGDTDKENKRDVEICNGDTEISRAKMKSGRI